MKSGYRFCGGYNRISLSSVAKGMDAFNNVTKNVAVENNVPFVDLASVLPKTRDYFFDDFHWSEKGHKVAADALYRFIVSGNFISSQ
jgi:lysophospholipase L1-like esterase